MHTADHYRDVFNEFLKAQTPIKEPTQLYAPMSYILDLGGKRLRPVLTLMATDLLGGDYRAALNAALALELFHNFSLVHDDIMDAAPLRRGQASVHTKWDLNTGILSGDAMLIRSYQLLEVYEPALFKALLRVFSAMALEVCEGQQYDMDFESREAVRIEEYLHMIRCKTAVLLGACMKMGAMVAGASQPEQDTAHAFGINLGIAFQLQDDYLDAFGNPDTFGKQLGGDIIENKKTYLYLKSLELADAGSVRILHHLFSVKPGDQAAKINTVRDIYDSSGASTAIRKEIEAYTERAFDHLEQLQLPGEAVSRFKAFGLSLMDRNV